MLLKITPTLISAALAGAFSALTWPVLWKHFGQSASSGHIEVILGTLLLVALPAHAFVLGFGHRQAAQAGLDTALLKRVGAWLGAAAGTVLLTGIPA